LLQGELVDRVQHPIARPPVDIALVQQQVRIDQDRKAVEGIRGDGFDSLQCAAAGEDGEAAKKCLVVGDEEIVGPGNRVPRGAMAIRATATTAGEQR
jgi:hypothetical protein